MKTEDGFEERINNHMSQARMLQRPQQLDEPEDLFDFDVQIDDMDSPLKVG